MFGSAACAEGYNRIVVSFIFEVSVLQVNVAWFMLLFINLPFKCMWFFLSNFPAYWSQCTSPLCCMIHVFGYVIYCLSMSDFYQTLLILWY